DAQTALALECRLQFNRREQAVLGDGDQSAVAHPSPQRADDEAVIGERLEVEIDVAQAPVIMQVPFGANGAQVSSVALGRLEALGAEEHSLMPMNGSGCHGRQSALGYVGWSDRESPAWKDSGREGGCTTFF